MNEIESYLENLGFTRNDWGFLKHFLEGIEFTLLHDPINGYILRCVYHKKRESSMRSIKLGREPKITDMQNAFEKAYTI